MKILNRIVAFLSATAMTCMFGMDSVGQAFLKASANGNETENTSVVSDATIEANNSVGSLIMKAGESSNTDTEEKSSDAFGISEAVVEGNSVKVNYYAADACDIVVGFYSDDGTKLLTSCKQNASATLEENGNKNGEISIPLPSDVPEYYLLKAYILGQFQIPLGNVYSTELYTKNISDIRNAVASDFDEKYVVQLDENEDTNFLVLSESTIQISYDGKHNILESYDKENGIYVFTNADKNLTSLRNDDVVYYDYNNQEDMIVFTVGKISIDGTNVTIQETEMELSDAFDLAKIEYEEYALPDEMEEGTVLESGLVYNGLVEDIDNVEEKNDTITAKNLPQRVNSPHSILAGAQFSGDITPEAASYTLDAENLPEKEIGYAKVGVSGSVGIKAKIPIKWKLYVNWLDSYAEIKVTPEISITGEFGISGELNIPITSVKGKLLKLAEVDVGLYFQIKGEATANFSCSLSVPFILTIGNSDAELLSMEAPELKGTLKAEATLFAGIVAKAEGKIGKYEASAEVSGGAEASGTLLNIVDASTSEGVTSSFYNPDEKHTCVACFDGEVELKFSAKMKYPDPNKENAKRTRTIAEASLHLFDFYFSLDNKEFGFNDCPHKSYRVLFTVTDENGNKLENAAITLTTGLAADSPTNLTTDSNGQAWVYWFSSGDIDYFYTATYGNMSAKDSFTFKNAAKKISVQLKPDTVETEPATSTEDNKTETTVATTETEKETTYTAISNSGDCGDNLTWFLYDTGTLIISGEGVMAEHPWTTYKRDIKRVIIQDGITDICASAFDGCTNLKAVEIPDSVTSIGHYAFKDCTGLTEVTIPGSVKQIGDDDYPYGYTFSGCTGLKSVTLEEGIEEINNNTFRGCNNLTSIVIPDSVSSIYREAFYNCSNLADIYYTGTEEAWNAISIGSDNDCLNSSIIHYNSGITTVSTLNAYAAVLEPEVHVLSMETNSEVKEYTYTEAVADTEYLLLIVKDAEAEDILSSDNLVYIDQQTADENGVTFRYVVPDGCTYIFIGDFGKGEYCRVVSDEISTDTALCTICKSKRLPGDADGDGEITLRDVVRIHRFVAGWNVSINESNSDVDGDGEITLRDVVRIHRFIAGWNVVLK